MARRVRMIHGDAERLDDRTGSRTCGQQFGASNLVISFNGFASRRAAAPCRQRSRRSPASIATGASSSKRVRPTARGVDPCRRRASLSTVARATAQVSGCEIGRRTASGPWRAPRIGRRISPCYRSSRSSDAHTRTRRSIAPRRRPMDTSSVSRLEIAPGDRLRERDTRHSPSRDGAADRSPVRYAATHRRFCDNVEGHPRAYATALDEPRRSGYLRGE